MDDQKIWQQNLAKKAYTVALMLLYNFISFLILILQIIYPVCLKYENYTTGMNKDDITLH